VVSVGVQPAEAQDDRYEACAAYSLIVGTGGSGAVAAAEKLRAIGAPNPPGVDDALDVVIDAEDGVDPVPDQATVEAARATLDGYFGGICADVDICPLVRQATATNDASSAGAAALARDLSAPSPPGIDAAFAVIAGIVTPAETGFYDSVASAQQALTNYFTRCNELAFTGSDLAAPLSVAGLTMVAAGAMVLTVRRRIGSGG
jgi:hypothetical protein